MVTDTGMRWSSGPISLAALLAELARRIEPRQAQDLADVPALELLARPADDARRARRSPSGPGRPCASSSRPSLIASLISRENVPGDRIE